MGARTGEDFFIDTERNQHGEHTLVCDDVCHIVRLTHTITGRCEYRVSAVIDCNRDAFENLWPHCMFVENVKGVGVLTQKGQNAGQESYEHRHDPGYMDNVGTTFGDVVLCPVVPMASPLETEVEEKCKKT